MIKLLNIFSSSVKHPKRFKDKNDSERERDARERNKGRHGSSEICSDFWIR